MKILLALLLSLNASAAVTEPDRALIERGRNILLNGGAENGKANTVASGGTYTIGNTTANILEGNSYFTWDSNSAGQTFDLTRQAIKGLAGTNGEATCFVQVPSGTATHTMGIWDGTTLTNTATLSNQSGQTMYVPTTINFIFGSSGSAGIRFTSVNANEPSINIDKCYLGPTTNTSKISQAILVDAVVVTGCAAAWSTTSTSYASFGTQTGCTYTASKGVASAPASNIPAFKFASLPPGDYRIEYEGTLSSTTANTTTYYQFTDGTNLARETSAMQTGATGSTQFPGLSQTITYTSPQSNVTLELKAKVDAGATAKVSGITASPGVFKLYYFPTQSQQAVSSAQADYDWTSFTPTYSAGFGTVTSSSCYKKRRGPDLFVKCTGQTGTVAASTGSIDIPDSLSIDTSKNPATVGAANYRVGSFDQDGAANRNAAVVTVPGTSTTKVFIGPKSSDTSILAPQNMSAFYASSTPFSLSFVVPISGWSENQRAPILIGSVTSNSTGAERIERAGVTSTCSSSPCTIASQSGSWLTNITRASTGNYTANFSTSFSSAPQCWVSCEGSGVQNNCFARMSTISSSAVTFISLDSTSGPSVVDSKFSLLCMGPR